MNFRSMRMAGAAATVLGSIVGAAETADIWRPSADWRPIDVSRQTVKAGTALDLYPVPDGPAGQFGRVIINAKGRFAFERNPEKTVRFFGFSSGLDPYVWRDASDADFKALADELARAIRRQGYNYVRFHGFDRWITEGNSAALEVTAHSRDRWDYLQAALKREGVYIQLVVLSFSLYEPVADYKAVYNAREMHKVMYYVGRDWEIERFREAAKLLLNHVNPYTGLAWKDDPAVAVVETYNEAFLGMQRLERVERNYPAEYALYVKTWREWFAARHGGKMPELDRLPIRKNDRDAGEYTRFLFDLAVKAVERSRKIIREIGFNGPITQNASHRLLSSAVGWTALEAVDNHGYFCHPSKWSTPGSITRQDSAAGTASPVFCRAAGERFPGRPMLIGEYNHAYWNQYQYENPLALPAYAALQDFSVLCIHEYPVMIDTKIGLTGFRVGANPVLRAGEFLAYNLFFREDAAASPHLVTVAVPNAYWEKGIRGQSALVPGQTKAALLTGFGVEFPDLKPFGSAAFHPDLRMAPAGTAGIFTHEWYSEVIEGKNDAALLTKLVESLRKRGILKPENRTDPGKGIFESDTGELQLRTRDRVIRAVTPRTEAVALPGGAAEKLGCLNVLNTSVGACVGVTDVSGTTLEHSTRMVLVYSTCVANTGLRLSADRSRMLERGRNPVLLQTGRLAAELSVADAGNFKLYALGIDGERIEEIPLRRSGGKLLINIDTAALAKGPAVFFELVREEGGKRD